MSISQDSSRFSRSFDDAQCVWMTAGVLAYQLCNREYDCDDCPLDIALRKHFSDESHQLIASAKASFPEGGGRLREDRRYSENHTWVQERNGEMFRVGVEPQLARALLIPKSVVLPSLGQKVSKHQTSVWIVLEEGTFPIASPLDGIIVSRNPLVAEQPSNVLQRPFDEGWLYEVESPKEAAGELLNVQQATSVYERDIQQLNKLLIETLKSQTTDVGPTLADGGMILQHIADMLGYKKYMKIVKMVYG
ncbi:MAG: glycine cleavage system protein H [Bacteroidetes bacterium]|nr:MAG: glycine cleavage system protein H [Bacteroidota bacterium]